MRSFVPMNNASNVIAMNYENHRLKKSQEVDLFIHVSLSIDGDLL